MEGPALRLRGVDHAYATHLGLRRHVVLRGIDLELARGRTLGIAGPNGSGKSTLLRLAAGIAEPSAGSIEVLGLAPCAASARRRVGYLAEESRFPAELTLRGALRLCGALQGMPGRACRVESERLLGVVGLTARAGTTIGRASRGMLRRFGLAQAWLHAPELILLDEPTAGLDAQGFDVLATLLAEARARRAAVVLASHVLSDLSEACDEVLILLDGRVARHGTPGEVLGGASLLDVYRRHATGIAR